MAAVLAGQPGEQWTMFFYDPSGNALEFKASQGSGVGRLAAMRKGPACSGVLRVGCPGPPAEPIPCSPPLLALLSVASAAQS